MSANKTFNIDDLLNIMARLRDGEHGCAWDIAQDFSSIVKHTIEEAYEVADVIERGVMAQLPDELGDLLFQIVFYSQLGKEQQLFDFSDVVSSICDKLLRRHPHVFAGVKFATDEERAAHWQNDKVYSRAVQSRAEQSRVDPLNNGKASLLDDIPLGMPALSRANKIQQRVAHHGFDWPSWHGCFDKVKEELAEVEVELRAPQVDASLVNEELGDLMFALVNLVRSQGLDPEQTLRQANAKFERRFRSVEILLLESGSDTSRASLDDMEAAWQQVKHDEKLRQ
ncbi:MAG: nucleoside triphosphate pyrophosphohydrolase [Psychrobium sp.]|nr:nucleoside triphosphate pyrophosphohydrolase [Psychrobium sp.]